MVVRNSKLYVEGFTAICSRHVGIGTTNPVTLLETTGAIHAHDASQGPDNGYNGLIRVTRTPASGQYINLTRNGNVVWSLGTVYNSNTFAIGIGQATDSAFTAPTLSINTAGNVGIGTTSPGAKLDISASDSAVTYPTMGTGKGSVHISPTTGTNDNSVAITFGADSNSTVANSAQAGIYVQSSSFYGSKMYFGTTNAFATGSQSRMMIDSAGNVGIGTASPTQGLLTVNGNVVALGQSPAGAGGSYVALTNTIGNLPGYPSWSYPTIKTDATNLYLSISGNYSGYFAANGAYVSVSDRNRKENFVEVNTQELLEKLDGMPMFEWNFKGEDPGVRHIGPIAQDFHDSFHLNGSDEKKISHIDPSGVAIVGVKGLLTRVKGLESENAALKARADKAETESAQLKAALCSKFPDLPLCKFNASN